MDIKQVTTTQRKAVFTRAEIQEKLGIDLGDFFLVLVEPGVPKTLEFYYTEDV
jgi:hypothetical protein